MRKLFTGITFIWLLWGITACNPARQLEEGKFILKKNIIDTDNPALKEDLKSVIKQRPNRRILGLYPFHLKVYTFFNRGKETKFKSWVKRTIGEEPVVLDSSQTERSTKQMDLLLDNMGYFNGEVTDTTYFNKRRRAKVKYHVTAGSPYIIKKLSYKINDPVIKNIVFNDSTQSSLKVGTIFNTDNFQKDRERITNLLGNWSYYDFNQQYIVYNVDSSFNSNSVEVELVIKNPDDSDSTKLHRKYRIKDIYIRTDYDPISLTENTPSDTTDYLGYYFLNSDGKPEFRPEALSPRVYVEADGDYALRKVTKTYRGLSSFGIFRFVNIRFEPIELDSAGYKWLDSYISLTPLPKQDYKIELEGTHNGGNFGVGGNLSYRNKNTFRGIESLELKLRASMETLPNFIDSTASKVKPFEFNTFEFGPEVNIRIPRVLWPFNSTNKSKLANPVTLLSTSYNYQNRTEFKKRFLILSTGLEYSETKYKKHIIYPAEINYTDVTLTNAFIEKLLLSGDALLLLYYRDYIITNGRYSFIYNNQDPKVRKNFSYLRFNCEFAGNSLRLIDKLSNTDYSSDSTYSLLGIEYSQYIRPELEYRYYQSLPFSSQQLVYRFNTGVGFAYLNSQFLPYEKVFYAGGANELRAFNPRRVGPGSYRDTVNFEQFGDVKLNMNIEYRFSITKTLKGAFFIDAGNVWLRDDYADRPGGQFKIENVADELAVGTGAGLRFDFTFFIFRIDGGIPLRDPSRPLTDRWVLNETKFNSVVYNLGIGYPF